MRTHSQDPEQPVKHRPAVEVASLLVLGMVSLVVLAFAVQAIGL
ncbi:MAG TPA: hypothetical protein VHG70_01610 [Nocardioidaceae bacterium]|jgi:hypothetical protein|nr:hypothetical protein [Nocardioidaceae bacterium]